jgi:hypothetical protein
MPASEPRPFAGHPDVVVVDLWGLGAVYVQIGAAASATERLTSLDVDWSASPSTLVPLLSAADALPPGILPDDLLSTGHVAGDELTASVPAPLAAWAAGGAKQRSPRVRGVRTDDEMSQAGRVRLKLDDSLEWALEVEDGGSWRPANGDRP